MAPDSGKTLRDNLLTGAQVIALWSAYFAATANNLGDDSRFLRMSLRVLAGGLNYTAAEARRAVALIAPAGE